jgi:hypothetical protein
MAPREERLEKYGEGPWMDEPDRIEWRHNGFPCLMQRNMSGGNWCGYVGVTEGHPWFQKGLDGGSHCRTCYGDESEECETCKGTGLSYDLKEEPTMHGGCTYTGMCAGDICHIPRPGESAEVWWVGFDFAHHMDLSPGFKRMTRMAMELQGQEARDFGEIYRDMRYVKSEVERVSDQATQAG